MALRSVEWGLVGLLTASSVAAIVMLLTDTILWEFAPTHAYAVIGFILIFVILMGTVIWRPALGVKLTLAWSVLLILAMALDPLTATINDPITGKPFFGGYTPMEALDQLWTGGVYPTFAILFALVVITLIVSVWAWRTAPKA